MSKDFEQRRADATRAISADILRAIRAQHQKHGVSDAHSFDLIVVAAAVGDALGDLLHPSTVDDAQILVDLLVRSMELALVAYRAKCPCHVGGAGKTRH